MYFSVKKFLNMSKTNLHKEKARCKHGEYGDDFKDYPVKVKQYYDRHCGSKDDRVEKKRKQEKEDKKEFDRLKNQII